MFWSTAFISIHALRVEGDIGSGLLEQHSYISIHALRVEGDITWELSATSPSDFYPRPPGGGRPLTALEDSGVTDISIHALRVEGDNIAKFDGSFYTAISIHALRVEGDRRRFCLSTRHPHHFYPRPPGGGRQGRRLA